ncbi:hypothetical protein TPCG7_07370 [Cutibacterium granulosum]|nr:hypothetical protein TPCG7_07370 [Cutibacterium granulosum]
MQGVDLAILHGTAPSDEGLRQNLTTKGTLPGRLRAWPPEEVGLEHLEIEQVE